MKRRAEKQNAKKPPPDKQQCSLGWKTGGDEGASGGDCPLQPVFNAELGKPIAGMQDQCDDGGAHAIEDRGHRLQVTEIHVESAQCGDDDEVREDESPAPRPGAPKTATEIGNLDSNPDRKKTKQPPAN